MKNLIVYYSYEGNTEALVNGLRQTVEADVLRLEPEKEKISKGIFRFVWGGMQVYMTKAPKLKAYSVDLSKYDNIIIGSPCWFGTYAPPINTFLKENIIRGKNICLFVCNGGNLRNTWSNFEKALAGNKIAGKLSLKYPIKNGIAQAQNALNTFIAENIN